MVEEIRLPQPVQPPQFVQRVEPSQVEEISEDIPMTRKKHKMADLFGVPHEDDNDIYTDDLVTVTDRDIMGGDPDMSDLTSVPDDWIMNGNRGKSKPTKRYRRTERNYPAPPSLGGIQY